MMDTGIADRIRAKGVVVVEVAGWQTLGSNSFNPRGSVNHHTAGPSSGSTPSLQTVIYGRPDVPGPLCNVLQSREPGEGNDKAYIIAAGKANHAGDGGWNGLSGNSSVFGLEIEHTGTAPLAAHRQNTAARIHAAMMEMRDASNVCQHREWAPSRKIDAAEDVNANHFRDLVRQYQSGGGPPPDTGDFDLSQAQFDELKRMIDSVGSALNKHIQQEDETQKLVEASRARIVQSESGGFWVVTDQGRWSLQPYGQFSAKDIYQWLQVLGLAAPGTPTKADNDYLHGIPKLNAPGAVPSS